MTVPRNLPTNGGPVELTILVSRDAYVALCMQAGSLGVSATTRAARILEAHTRALYAETQRDPRDYRLDA